MPHDELISRFRLILSQTEIDLLFTLLVPCRFKKGEYIIRSDQPARSLFIISQGSVDVIKSNSQGVSSVLSHLPSGNIVGELAFIDQQQRSADVIAHEDVEVLELPYQRLEDVSTQMPSIGLKFYQLISSSLGAKLRATNTDFLHSLASSHIITLGTMSGYIVHEISQPMASMNLFLDMIEENLSKNELELAQKTLLSAKKSVLRMSEIMRGIRILSQSGNQIEFKSVLVDDILNDTVTICKGRFTKSGTKFETSFNCAAVYVQCSQNQIIQVLVNLLNNALDAIKNLKTQWVRVDATSTETHVQITVTDSGNGIPIEIQKEIFQPFFSTKSADQGTGLGLSLSKRIAETHQGELFVDTTCENTTFVLRLPRVSSA